jgi:acetolactate synthase I/II/III large subunit
LVLAFGWQGYRGDNSVELLGVLEDAFEQEGPSLIKVAIDYRENALLTGRLGNIVCAI